MGMPSDTRATDPTIWLQQHVPGFDLLSTDERAAIEQFTLLWGLFEFSILKTHGSATQIVSAIADLGKRHRPLPLNRFEDSITYFRQRYYSGGDFTERFEKLYLRNSDRPDLVKSFITAETQDALEVLSGLLIIILRLRNNLFHGIKWAYGIQGQLENFRHANIVLMLTMDLHRT